MHTSALYKGGKMKKRIFLFCVLVVLMLFTACKSDKVTNIYEYLETINIYKSDIQKIYVPNENEDCFICLYEKNADEDSKMVEGGLILIERNIRKNKFKLSYSNKEVYSKDINLQTFITYYFAGPDSAGENHNFVVGGRFLTSDKNDCKPYIEFSNGDIMLIKNYRIVNNNIYFYIDIGTEYIVYGEDNEYEIMSFDLETICE